MTLLASLRRLFTYFHNAQFTKSTSAYRRNRQHAAIGSQTRADAVWTGANMVSGVSVSISTATIRSGSIECNSRVYYSFIMLPTTAKKIAASSALTNHRTRNSPVSFC